MLGSNTLDKASEANIKERVSHFLRLNYGKRPESYPDTSMDIGIDVSMPDLYTECRKCPNCGICYIPKVHGINSQGRTTNSFLNNLNRTRSSLDLEIRDKNGKTLLLIEVKKHSRGDWALQADISRLTFLTCRYTVSEFKAPTGCFIVFRIDRKNVRFCKALIITHGVAVKAYKLDIPETQNGWAEIPLDNFKAYIHNNLTYNTETIHPVIMADNSQAISELLRASFIGIAEEMGFTQANCPNHIAFITQERLMEQLGGKNAHCFGIREEGAWIGFVAVALYDDGYEITRLAVYPAHRHKGYGRALMDRACEKARELGLDSIGLGMLYENKVLRRWYEGKGFVAGEPFTPPCASFLACGMSKRLI
jgi:ribosomal protein S18 acetylase RimI-like enzyme